MTNVRGLIHNVKSDVPYAFALEQVQRNFPQTLSESVDEIGEDELKESLEKYIADYDVTSDLTEDMTVFVEYLYHDMAGYSFISREKLFEKDGFEELNINSWEDIDIILKGHCYKTNYRFASPKQAQDIHKRMLRKTSSVTIDDASPIAITDLGPNIRVSVMKSPVIDENVGIVSSIRKVDSSTATRETLLKSSSLTEEMLSFLELASQHGISMCFAGDTGTGKTFLSGYIIGQAAKKLRVYTIEEGSREWDFVQRDESGKIINSVIHTKTRPSADSTLAITQNLLLATALRFDPDIIGVGEMRSDEAYTAMESALTGHVVITTTHSLSADDTPRRIIALAKKAFDFSDDTLLTMACKAFPVIVYLEKLPDGSRRVTEISEILSYRDGEINMHSLWEYEVFENIYHENGKVETVGEFMFKNPISQSLAQKMLKKGATRLQVDTFRKAVE